MKAVVPVKDILPNPYQARKKIDRQSIKALAEEIKEVGLWSGALRGRMKGSRVELCYGHRRLHALKLLGYKEVEIDIVDLTDEEMAMQSLAENFQREGLTDIEKAEGIRLILERLRKRGMKESEAMQKVSKIVGLSPAWIRDLLSLLTLEASVQRAIRDRRITGRTALEAHRLGGKGMVDIAIRNKLPVHRISAIAQKLRRIPDEKIKQRLYKEVLGGKLVQPDKVEERARKLLKGRKIRAPENLDQIASDWQYILHHWNEKIEELLVYKRYLRDAGGFTSLKNEAEQLVRRLERISK
ncbi:MAG: ParB/RepB/Spo0J family partition protein [Planctomycetota bacterium]|jgi:ParB/RepB/Spo0J family partition protein